MDSRGFIIYFAIGCLWSLYKMKTPMEKIEEQLNEDYSIQHSKMFSDFMKDNRRWVFVIYAIFWPVNMFYTLKYKIFKK